MNDYILKPRYKIAEQPDGSWTAASADIPLLAVAPTREDLTKRVDEASNRFAAFLSSQSESELVAFLLERGTPYESSRRMKALPSTATRRAS